MEGYRSNLLFMVKEKAPIGSHNRNLTNQMDWCSILEAIYKERTHIIYTFF